jgi:hypothetical protein
MRKQSARIAKVMVAAGCCGLSVAAGLTFGFAAGLAVLSVALMVFGLLAVEVAP